MVIEYWFRNLTISRKLLLGFGLVLALMCGTLVADTMASSQQAALANRIVHHLDPARLNARNIVTLVRSADDDGYWAQGAMVHNMVHARALFAVYYQELGHIRTVLAMAMTLADTEAQRAAIRRFRRSISDQDHSRRPIAGFSTRRPITTYSTVRAAIR